MIKGKYKIWSFNGLYKCYMHYEYMRYGGTTYIRKLYDIFAKWEIRPLPKSAIKYETYTNETSDY